MAKGDSAGTEPAIVQYWDSEAIPDYIEELLASFEELNPGLPHRVFGEREASELIAERYGARQAAAFAACRPPAMQADYFRYCAVHALGGVYADADFRCVASLRGLLTGVATGTLFGRPQLPPRWRTPAFEWRERVGPYRALMNSLFAFPSPGHPLLELAIEVATVNVERQIAEDVALVTGPAVFTSLYLLRELGSFDAFVDYTQGGVLASSASLVCETIGDYGRVLRAFDGVDVIPEEETRALVDGAAAGLPYKQDERNWLKASASIYR